MGIFSSIKNALVQSDEVPVQAQPPVRQTLSIGVTPSIASNKASDGKMKQLLMEAVSNKVGTTNGFFQFKKTVEDLKTAIPDTRARCTTACIALKSTVGVTKEKLLESFNTVLQTVECEAKTFEQETTKTVEVMNQEAVAKSQNIVTAIDTKRQMLQTLTEEISKLTIQKTEEDIKLQQEKDKIVGTQMSFRSSYQELVNELRNDINDISTVMGV